MKYMNREPLRSMDIDFTAATQRAMRVRRLYHQLEKQNHQSEWSIEEDMLAFTSDIGILARLVMASQGRWLHGGDAHTELRGKIAECLWWLLVLSERMDIDITKEFKSFMDKLDTELDG